MLRDEACLLDIARAATLVLQFRGDISQSAFMADLKTQSAILHQLLILGEAVKRLSEPFRATHPEVPWRLISGMRDHLIHGYDAVDLDEVWRMAEVDMPELLRHLTRLRPQKES